MSQNRARYCQKSIYFLQKTRCPILHSASLRSVTFRFQCRPLPLSRNYLSQNGRRRHEMRKTGSKNKLDHSSSMVRYNSTHSGTFLVYGGLFQNQLLRAPKTYSVVALPFKRKYFDILFGTIKKVSKSERQSCIAVLKSEMQVSRLG